MKKGIAIICAVGLILALLLAAAVGIQSSGEEQDLSSAAQPSEDGQSTPSAAQPTENAATPLFHGAQLEGEAREIYDRLDAELGAGDPCSPYTVTMELQTLTLTEADFENGTLTEAAAQKWDQLHDADRADQILWAAAQARMAWQVEHPQVSWLVWLPQESVQTMAGEGLDPDTPAPGTYWTQLSMEYDVLPAYADESRDPQADQTAAQAQVDAIVAALPEGASDYDKLSFFNQWLCEHNTYNFDSLGTSDFARGDELSLRAVSALLPDLEPVCQGYAMAFQWLCNQVDIPCITVSGVGHMWNYVRLDGAWYLVDVTYNDEYDRLNHSGYEQFFLIGSEDDSYPEDHVPTPWSGMSKMDENGEFVYAPYIEFVYPTLSTSRYTSGGD